MARAKGGRQVAVLPKAETTPRLAKNLAPRARDAGIEIAFVDERGRVTENNAGKEHSGSDDSMNCAADSPLSTLD